MEDELVVLVMEQNDPTNNGSCFIFIHKADASVPVHIVDALDEKMVLLPSKLEFITVQAADELCQVAAKQLSQIGIEITINKVGVIVRRALINGGSRILVPASFCMRLLTLVLYPPLSAHPGQGRLYDTIC